MPGIITSPMTAMLFSVGVSAAVVAERKDGSAASRHVAPRASASSTTRPAALRGVREERAAAQRRRREHVAHDHARHGHDVLASHGGLSARTKRPPFVLKRITPARQPAPHRERGGEVEPQARAEAAAAGWSRRPAFAQARRRLLRREGHD